MATEIPVEIDAEEFHGLLASGQISHAADRYQAADPSPDAARALFGRLTTIEAVTLVSALTDDTKAREVLLWLPREQGTAIVANIEPSIAARLIGGMPSDKRADVLAALSEELRAAIQGELPADVRADTARLLSYAPDTAGGLMETEFLAYPAAATTRDAIRDIRANRDKYSAIGVQYLYLLDGERRLIGVAPIRDLMLAPEDAALTSLVKRTPAVVRDQMGVHDIATAFDEHAFMALPVVDDRGVMLGVVTRADVTESEQHEAEDDYRVSQGIVGGEELRSMRIAVRFRRRTVWLGVNLLLCLGGAGVVSLHRETLTKAIVIAAMLPVISASSGNAAIQATAVSIRELTLGIIEPCEWRRVLIHEFALAAAIAVPLGAAVGVLAWLWGAGWMVGLLVSVAMALNTVIAIAVGAMCPLLLRAIRVDAALASGPITTTIADVCGFALTLGLVAWVA